MYSIKTVEDEINGVKDLMKDVLQSILKLELNIMLGYDKYDCNKELLTLGPVLVKKEYVPHLVINT